MREPRTVVEWLPLTLALTAVSGKIMGFLLMWSGSILSVPLLSFVFLDMIPMQVADAVRKVFFNPRGGAPSIEGNLVFGAILLLLTALQWYGAGALLRWWIFRREPVPVTPVRFR